MEGSTKYIILGVIPNKVNWKRLHTIRLWDYKVGIQIL